jgi:hypothetical protein
VWNKVATNNIYFPGTKDVDARSQRSLAEYIESLRYEYQNSRKLMEKEL